MQSKFWFCAMNERSIFGWIKKKEKKSYKYRTKTYTTQNSAYFTKWESTFQLNAACNGLNNKLQTLLLLSLLLYTVIICKKLNFLRNCTRSGNILNVTTKSEGNELIVDGDIHCKMN